MSQGRTNITSNRRGQADEPPRVGVVRLGPALTGVLYALLAGSAALALWVRQSPTDVPAALEAASPWVFLAFLTGFTLYRLVMVRAGKYPAAKAFFQIGAGVLFFMLLLPWSRGRYVEPVDPVELLLADPNPHARALAAEVARYRPDGQRYGRRLARALQDRSPTVREEAHRSLVRLTGEDLGPPEDPAAVKRWSERYP